MELLMKYIINFTDHRKVIGTVVSREDYLVPKAGGVFNAEEYDAHPERYRSTFAEKVFITDVDLDFTTLNFLRYIHV